MNLALLLKTAVQAHPDAPAITVGERTLTYHDMWDEVRALGAGLEQLGLSFGDRVAIFMDNCPEYLVSLFAIFSQGLCVVPLNSQFTSDEVHFHLSDSGARVIIHNDRLTATVTEALSNGGISPQRIFVGDEGTNTNGCIDYRELLTPVPRSSSDLIDADDSDLAWLFYTSGTTGRPKGAMLTTGNVRAVVVHWLADLIHMESSSVTLHTAPLSHAAGFHALTSLSAGGRQILLGKARFEPESFISTVSQYSVTDTWMVPTQVNRIARYKHLSTDRLKTLRTIIYGGAPYPLPDLKFALHKLGPILTQIFGQGETPMTATILTAAEHEAALRNDERILSTAGRPRLGIEVITVNDQGSQTPPGTAGEIIVRGPSVMVGYWQQPHATAETLRNGWLHTGDIGFVDEHGYLTIIDRLKDMIISGGSNVYAREVEDVILTFPGITSVAVIGLPDSEWGEVVTAVVVPDAETSIADSDIIAFCKESLAGYKVPKRVIFLDALPLSSYGKVSKRQIREFIQDLQMTQAQSVPAHD